MNCYDAEMRGRGDTETFAAPCPRVSASQKCWFPNSITNCPND
ncbi:MAG: hypothetical protein V7641_740 [Blastocatellia bacterium]